MTKDSLRKCVGCGEMISRYSMIKITKEHSTGEVIVNPDSKTFGRSVYLCYNQDCIENAFKKGKINRVLKSKTQIDKEAVMKLLEK